MLWCRFLPCGLLGYLKATIDPPTSVVAFGLGQLVVNSTHGFPSSTTTVTVTVGIVATPVVHTYAPPRMTATPRAVPSYDDEYIDTPFRIIPDSVVAYQNVLYTFGDWFENAGFDVDFRVTPLRLTLAAFMLGWLQLAFMIWFGDYELPLKTVKCLFRGFHSGSKVLWSILLGLIMYFTYDQLTENPINLVVAELFFVNDRNPDFVARFIKGTVMSWSRFGDYSPWPRKPTSMWLLDELFQETFDAQEKRQFTPKTFTELIVGILVGLFRLGVTVSSFCAILAAAVWDKVSPMMTKLVWALLGLAWTVIVAAFHHIDVLLMKYDFTWDSLLVFLFIRLPTGIWQFFHAIYIWIILAVWIHVMDPHTPFVAYIDMATFWEQREALYDMASMSIWDMARVVIERNNLKKHIANIEPVIREQARQDVNDTIKTLAERAISWRTSHYEMLKDYNHCRMTLDRMVHTLLCVYMGVDAKNGTGGRILFNSAYLVSTEEPSPNGLHYKPSNMSLRKIRPEVKSACERNTANMFRSLRRGVVLGGHNGVVPTMDLYNKETWGFELQRFGFGWAPYHPESAPFDLSKRRVIPEKRKEIEDYALDGRIMDWYKDLPARLERQQQLKHPFYAGR